MKKLFSGFDWFLFVSILICLSFGLLILKSVAPDLFFQQLFFSVVGLIIYIILSVINLEIIEKFSLPLYFIFVTSLLGILIFGKISRGSARWFQLGANTIQPSELAKPFIVLTIAVLIEKFRDNKVKRLFYPMIFLFIPFLLVFLQPDLGSAVIYLIFWIFLFIGAKFDWRLLAGGALLVLVISPIGWRFLADYQKDRIVTFLEPSRDPLGRGFSVLQSMTAVGSGMLVGRGLGWGTQSHLKFLPEKHTDFIFASFAEEFGFVGSVLLIIVFLIIFWRIIKASQIAVEEVPRLYCLGILGIIFGQWLINIGMNMGIMPVTGITLPLISYGGSSMLSTLVSLGLVASIAREGGVDADRKVIEIG